MEKSSFFNAVETSPEVYDRAYFAEDFANYFNAFIGNGVFPIPSTGLQVVTNGNMTVTVKAGRAYINGYMYNLNADLILPISVADGVLKRIDRIVIKYDVVGRAINAVVIKGTLSSSPVAPVLQRDTDAYELGIADIMVSNGVTSISYASITDQRGNGNLCGIVNNLFAVQNIQASSVFINDASNNYDNTTVESVLDELKRPLNVYRTNLDATNNIFVGADYKRTDGTLFKRKTLSNLTDSNYLVQTINFYATNGTTLNKTEIYDLSYDIYGNLQNEVKR